MGKINWPKEFTAGEFVVECGCPYPYWTTITYSGRGDPTKIRGIHHNELRDLEHCLSRMVAAIRRDLGDDAAEMD